MAETVEASITEPSIPLARGEERIAPWQWIGLGIVMVISLWMNFFQLGQRGFANLYYASGVRSMLDNWHNFFFMSFDPGGFVTVDKPPLGFWLQTISAKLFGFTPFSVYFPQALSGVLAVALLFFLVRRHFGVVAGLLAALFLALSPISVVTNRNNTIDSTLAFVLLLGAWSVFKAAETGKLRWLLLCMVLVGLGFNIKMLEAYLVLPAFCLLYLLAAPKKLWLRIRDLVLAVLVLIIISFSWALAVDLTPATDRPYVGSSQDNSEISLALGYNGINRLLGNLRGRDGNGAARQGGTTSNRPAGGATPPGNTQGAVNAGNQGAGGFMQTGSPGPLRLFQEPLGGQIAWLLPLALVSMLALAVQRRLRLQSDRQQQSLILWGTWLLTMGVFFSVAGFFHEYYLTEMAPAIAALCGAGLVVMWQNYRAGGWRAWLLPLALLLTAVEQGNILQGYPAWSWLIPPIFILVGLSILALLLGLVLPRFRQTERFAGRSIRLVLPLVSISGLILLFGPTIWAALPVLSNTESQLPLAGPGRAFALPGGGNFGGRGDLSGSSNNALRREIEQELERFAQGGGGGREGNTDPALLRYLEENQGKTKFLVATPSSNTADGIILATNKPVMALGGFGGSDPILTQDDLKTLIANNQVRYFLLPGGTLGGQGTARGFGGGFGSNSATTWVTQNCKTIPAEQWRNSAATSTTPPAAGQLYDCAA